MSTNISIQIESQGLVKGAKLCFRNPYFYFWHGESTSTASQLTSPASQKSKDLNKVLLLLQELGWHPSFCFNHPCQNKIKRMPSSIAKYEKH